MQTDEERVRASEFSKFIEVGLQTLGPQRVQFQLTNKAAEYLLDIM